MRSFFWVRLASGRAAAPYGNRCERLWVRGRMSRTGAAIIILIIITKIILKIIEEGKGGEV